MARLKIKHKRRFLLFALGILGVSFFALMIIPPMIHLDSLKPKIEEIILAKTGIPAKIHGKVNISLLGRTTIVAHDISVPNGVISTCNFTVPLHSIFNLKNADISGNINIKGASLYIQKIVPFDINTNINIRNSKIKFLNKEYYVRYAELSKKLFFANVETDQHRYQITSINDEFIIKNKNNELLLTGKLHPDGTATAHINITAQNINRWFEFEKPKITGQFPITADIKWNGKYGFIFSNISADGVTGTIILHDDGYKKIELNAKHADFDMSFILHDSEILKNSDFILNFYGKIKFVDKTFKHLYVNVSGSDNEIKINKIIADDIVIQNGTIDKLGGHNLSITMLEKGKKTTCLFNGTPNDWYCEKFSYDNKIFGKLNVNKKRFDATITSKTKLPEMQFITDATQRFGKNGIIKFDFADAAGIITLNEGKVSLKYNFIKNKNLTWANIGLPFLPEFMTQEIGDFVWQNDTMMFVPHSQTWSISVTKDYFIVVGNNLKKWFPAANLNFISDLPYTISGNYKRDNISNLKLEIAKHQFIGSSSGK